MSRKGVRTFSVAGAVLLLVLLLSTPPFVLAQDDKAPTEGTLSGGNTIYRVFVQDIAGAGVGLYTATTGSAHPAGAGLNVLFGGGFPGTTFNTIRSYTTSTDYVQTFFIPSSSNTVILLDSFSTVTPIGTTGFRTTYTLPGPPTTPDALTIISDVNVNGTTFSDSSIEVTTTVINNGPDPVDIGTRYHWDFQISGDDGPTFQEINPDGAVRILESEFVTPGFESYRIVDNDINPTPPTFFIFGTVTGPATVVPTPTAPDLLQYVCWPLAFSTAFDYTVVPTRDVATTASTDCRGFAGGDTAVHYFFGRDGATATTIPSNGENTVSASLFLTPPVVGESVTQTFSPAAPTQTYSYDNGNHTFTVTYDQVDTTFDQTITALNTPPGQVAPRLDPNFFPPGTACFPYRDTSGLCVVYRAETPLPSPGSEFTGSFEILIKYFNPATPPANPRMAHDRSDIEGDEFTEDMTVEFLPSPNPDTDPALRGRTTNWTEIVNVDLVFFQIEIDIKPGSFPNSIKLSGNGAIPVAILSTPSFDATTVDPSTVELNSAEVRIRGKGLQAHAEDVNGDSLLDLVVQIDRGGFVSLGDGIGVLTGFTFSNLPVSGTDSVRIVE